jgi:hypothetical protein
MKYLFVASLTFLGMLSMPISAMHKQLVAVDSLVSQELNDENNFTDLAMSKIKVVNTATKDHFYELAGAIKVGSTDPGEAANFKNFLMSAVKFYTPGMKFNAPTEIEISNADKINVSYLAQFILDQLMPYRVEHQSVSKELQDFKTTDITPFNDHSVKNNGLMFALMYYLSNKTVQPVEIKNSVVSYNNLNFVISPCLDEKGGKDMEFSFEKSNFFNTGASLYADSPLKDTVKNILRSMFNFPDGLYKFRFFKLAQDNSFRVQVELSSRNNISSQEFFPRKITHLHVLIQ